MADKIFDHIIQKDGETVIRHVLRYELWSGENMLHIEVVVMAGSMVDPDDAAEAKTIANVEASLAKTAWVAALAAAPTNVSEESTKGDVTLA